MNITAVILAGGLARRMGGGDKPLKLLAGQPILSHIIDRIKPQATNLIINANSDPKVFENFKFPIVADSIKGFAGPLAGILAGMDWIAENQPNCRYMISIPGDGPFFPRDLVSKLMSPIIAGEADLTVAVSGDRTQPVVGAWDVQLRDDLRKAIQEENIHKVDKWTSRYRIIEVPFSSSPIDPFFNTNKLEDMEEAERLFRIDNSNDHNQ